MIGFGVALELGSGDQGPLTKQCVLSPQALAAEDANSLHPLEERTFHGWVLSQRAGLLGHVHSCVKVKMRTEANEDRKCSFQPAGSFQTCLRGEKNGLGSSLTPSVFVCSSARLHFPQ